MATHAPATDTKKPATPVKAQADKAGAARGASGTGKTTAGHERFDRMAVRAKLAVSEPGDAVEREADAVASRVMRMPAQNAGQGMTGQQATAPTAADEGLVARLGSGMPLENDVRAFFEQRLNADLSTVRIYIGPLAAREAEKLSAKAFTIGEHIAFAEGQYQPDTADGKQLLAHELAHVLQQRGGVARQIMRNGGGAAASAQTPEQRTASAERDLKSFVVPASKRRHGHAFQAWLTSRQLKHGPDYDRNEHPPAQVSKWVDRLRGFESQTAWTTHFARLGISPESPNVQPIRFGGTEVQKPFTEWVEFFKRPQWSHAGTWLGHRLEVDHIVELQTAGWPAIAGGDEVENYELLDKSTNASSGGTIYIGLRQKMRTLIAAQHNVRPEEVPLRPSAGAALPDAETQLKTQGVEFDALEGGAVGDRRGGGRRNDADSEYWVLAELQAGEHLSAIGSPAAGGGGSGTAAQFVLLSGLAGGIQIARIPTTSGLEAAVSGSNAERLASVLIRSISFTNTDYGTAADGATIGQLDGTWRLPPGINPGGPNVRFDIIKAQGGQYNGFLGPPATLTAEFTALSPVEFSEIGIDGRGLTAVGRLMPSVPLLANQPIDVTWTHDNIRFARTFTTDNLDLSVPGISLDAASLTVFYDRNGFGVEGGIYFTLAHLGTGSLIGGVDGSGRFSAEGSLDIDTRVFDEANMRLWYRDGAFGGSGRVAITRPGRIRGVNAASVTVTADAEHIEAQGQVQPAIPGVQNASLTASYSADDGLLVGGDVQLANIAGIREGSLHAELRKRDDGWRVTANGRAVPALPGINSDITLSYDDGAFDGQLNAEYAHGIFSGNVMVGLTNRPVGPDGEIIGGGASAEGGADAPAIGDQLSLYGAGHVNARLTDWLQGGIGIKVRPSGDMLISGSIGIPEPITVFEQYPPPERARRTLFSMPTVSVPIVGISVGSTVVGIALTINGRVTGHAHIGPGQLTQTELRIEDFNPAQPESLHITGDAEFNLPAEAGVGASLDAGVTLGAAIINATAGLSVSAEAAVHADVTPRVDLDWRPSSGLHLHADLDASLSPRLAFDLNGFAEVTANAFVTTFSLWRKDWNLARREIGSSLTLGVHAPVDYYSDGRGVVFNPDDVQFQVPELNGDTLDQLLNEEGGSEHVERDESRAS